MVGQEWELPSAGSDDPLVLRIVQLLDDSVSVLTFRRSNPEVVLNRSTMRWQDVFDAGVLVAGPGSLDARRRRERLREHTNLLLYEARRVKPGPEATDVRFGGRDVVAIVAENEKVDRQAARTMLRDALGALGGREIANFYTGWDESPEIGYVIPIDALAPEPI